MSGKISINGRSIADYDSRQLREKIGVVNQEPVCLNKHYIQSLIISFIKTLFGTTIYENIRLGKENATRTEIEEAARQANAHDFIMQLPDV